MHHLSLCLFNSFQATLDDQPITAFESDKVRALLIYLAVEAQQAQRRETLAGLLWPDFDEQSARTNLRRALSNLRKAIKDGQAEPPFLLINRSELQFNSDGHYTLDVAPFLVPDSDLTISSFEARVIAYQGPFLAGFSLADSEPFEEWLTLKREQLRRAVLESLQKLIEHHETAQSYPSAIPHAYRLVDLEPWLEEGHQALMRLLALTEQRSKALQQFELCQKTLRDGLGVEVSEATKTLYEQIKSGNFGLQATPQKLVEAGKSATPFPAYSLPAPITSFVGRKQELDKLVDLITNTTTRLVTILGLGGIGKSHFSIEVGRMLLSQFTNGVFFVPLASIQQAEQIVPTIAEVVGYPLQSDNRTPERQLQDFFREKSLLLILDNMEELLDGVGLISDFLQAAPKLKIIVTSRERLKLHGETIFPLAGLTLSEDASISKPDDDAVRLFYNTARRFQLDFAIKEEHTRMIGTICRFVEGMPLAILMAAGWVDQLTLAEIVDELTEDTGSQLGLLETDLRDIPERHQHIHTVMTQSWRRLSQDERTVYMALSVFRGGFTREAAQTVANASLPILTNLVNRSFLSRTANGRYSVHELLRQFGALELTASPNVPMTRNTHTSYFAEFLSKKGSELKGPKQASALGEVEQEIGNIQQAWQWAIEQEQLTPIAQMFEGLGMFYEWKGRYSEGEAAFRRGAEQLASSQADEGMHNYVRMLSWQGLFVAALGQPDLAQKLLARSSSLIEEAWPKQEMLAEKAFNLWQQAKLIREQSHEEAKILFEDSLALFQVLGDKWSQAYLSYDLGSTISTLEPRKMTLFQQLMKNSLSLHKTVGNQFGALETLNTLGLNAALRGDFKQCDEWFKQAFIIDEQTENNINEHRYWLSSKGDAYWFMGRYEEALSVNQEKLAIAENFGERGSIMGTSASLGMSHIFLGHYKQGVELLETARVDCQQHGGPALLSYILLQLGGGYIAQRKYQTAYDTFRESIDLHRASQSNVRLYTALNNFGIAAWNAGKFAEAQAAQDEVLTYLAQDDNYLVQVGLLPIIALLQLSQNNPVLAVEYYALALEHPHIGNSQWHADITGRYIEQAAGNLPSEVVAAAQERGRARDLNATIQELAAIREIGSQ